MKELYGDTSSYKNQVLATWQFANEIKPGDIVFVKKVEESLLVEASFKAIMSTLLSVESIAMFAPSVGWTKANGRTLIRAQ